MYRLSLGGESWDDREWMVNRMKAYPEAYSKELDRLLVMSDVPAYRPENEYYTIRSKDGRLLAAGVCWKRWLHPERMRFYIAVEELYQRRGYGTMIFERMRADHPGAKWQGSADLDNDAAEWWLRGMGFEFACRSYWMDAMIADMTDPERYGLNVVPFKQLSGEQQNRLIAMAWTDCVRKYEQIDPLNEAVDAETFRSIALCGLDLEATCCLIENGEIRAYALCAAADDWTYSVKYVGHRLDNPEHFRRFLVEFANLAFSEKGGLMMEADSFDADALALMRLFGELPDDSYDTYTLE